MALEVWQPAGQLIIGFKGIESQGRGGPFSRTEESQGGAHEEVIRQDPLEPQGVWVFGAARATALRRMVFSTISVPERDTQGL